MSDAKLITLDNLKEFSDNCKETFSCIPIINNGVGNCITIEFSFTLSEYKAYTKPIFLLVKGLRKDDYEFLDTSIIISPHQQGILQSSMLAQTSGVVPVNTIILSYENEIIKLYIWSEKELSSVSVEYNTPYKLINSVGLILLPMSWESDSALIARTYACEIEGVPLLGLYIKQTGIPSFYLLTDSESYWLYPDDAETPISKIYKSEQANALAYQVQFLYSSGELNDYSPYLVYDLNGNLYKGALGLIAVIPKPFGVTVSGMTSESSFGTYRIVNGLVKDLVSSGITPATSTVIGGIKITEESSTETVNPAYVHLTNDNVAYINKNDLEVDIYRVDLNQSVYKDYPSNYSNSKLLYLHIGVTSSDFVHGYFYKAVLSPATSVLWSDTSLNIYIINPQSLEKLLYWRGLSIKDREYTLKVQDSWSETPPAITGLTFELSSTSPYISIVIPYSLLNAYEITINLTTLSGKTPENLTKIFTLVVGDSYLWKQWNVLPLFLIDGSDFLVISNADIDTICNS